MSRYQQSVPGQMCYYWYDACINATIAADGSGNAAQQYQCTQVRDSQCGNLTVDDSSVPSSSLSSAAVSIRNSASAARSSAASATRRTSSSSASASTGGPTSSSQVADLQSSKLSTGAIVGIVVGAVTGIGIGIAILWLCRSRRAARKALSERIPIDPTYSREKQVATSDISNLSTKPELHGDRYVSELQVTEDQPSHELSSTSRMPELDAERQAAELQSYTIQTDGFVQRSATTISPLQDHSNHADNRMGNRAPDKASGNHTNAQEIIAALEEEERCIDAEMTEVRRMKVLRDQKHAIQQKLREAKNAGPFEM